MACILLIIKKTNNDIYLKYFFDQKYSINYENKIKLKDTVYYKFLNDIKSTELNNIFSFLIEEQFGQSFLLHFINTFINIRDIDIESIAEYLKLDNTTISNIINNTGEGVCGVFLMELMFL